MKKGFRKAGTIFKYLTIIVAIVYWIFIIIDDWTFIEKYGSGSWLEYIGIWFGWFLIYLLVFSVYYWVIVTIVILTYYKFILKK